MRDVYAGIDQIVISEGYAASAVCDLLEVSRSGFYAWRSLQESVREQRDRELLPVIEDVFVGSGRAVRKPDWLPDPGLSAAARLVRRGGLLVSNAIDESPQVSRRMRALFAASVRIEIADYDNVVWVGGPGSLSAQGLRAAAEAHPLLRRTLAQLSFRSSMR